MKIYIFIIVGLITIPLVSGWLIFGFDGRGYWDVGGVVYDFPYNGYIRIRQANTPLYNLGFALRGTINGGVYTVKSFEYEWDINHSEYTYQIEEYDPVLDRFITKDKTGYFIRMSNNNRQLPTYITLNLSGVKNAKITVSITNNFTDITDAKFIFFGVIEDDLKTIIDESYDIDNGIHINSNFNNIGKRLEFDRFSAFDYSDLIYQGYDITDIYIGNGSLIGTEDKYIFAIAVTKNSGYFPYGMTAILDPSQTPYKIPQGFETGGFANPSRINESDNLYAISSVEGNYINATNFDFGVPDTALVTYIASNVEARAFALFCDSE